jgi:hypothetical protein
LSDPGHRKRFVAEIFHVDIHSVILIRDSDT